MKQGHTSLVLQLVQSFASFGYFCDVVAHDSNCIINLSLDCCGLGVSASGRVGRRATAGKIRIIRFRPVIVQDKCMAMGEIDE